MKSRAVLIIAVLIGILAACGPSEPSESAVQTAIAQTEAAQPVPTLVATEEPSSTPEPSETPMPTATPEPTSTPEPTATPTVTPIPLVGQITGRIIGADTQRPQASLQIILCLLSPATEGEPESCTLQGAPSAVSNADGAFELRDVLAGSYVLVFGRPDDEVSPAEDWAGLDVTTGQLCVVSLTGKRYVCPSEEVAFWVEGGDVLTGVERLTIGEDGKVEFFGVLEGIVRSDSVGLSVMIQDTSLAPVVQVRAGEATEVDWQLVGR